MSQNASIEQNPYAPSESPEPGTPLIPPGSYGGIGRLAYFGLIFLTGLISNLLTYALATTLSIVVIAVPIMNLAVGVFLIGLRLKNTGYSPWWCLGIFVPFLNILIAVRCIACPEGYAVHKKLDTIGKIIIGLFLLAIVLGLVLAVSGV